MPTLLRNGSEGSIIFQNHFIYALMPGLQKWSPSRFKLLVFQVLNFIVSHFIVSFYKILLLKAFFSPEEMIPP